MKDTAIAFSIDPASGSIRVQDRALLARGQEKEAALAKVGDLVSDTRDYTNGYEWLYLRGLSFGGEAATLALCFLNGRFVEASWSVQLIDAPIESAWPTREAINSEIAFVRGVLAGMDVPPGEAEWGTVWSRFDAKGFLAANGLRYRSEQSHAPSC
jgi:hypothetical protein